MIDARILIVEEREMSSFKNKIVVAAALGGAFLSVPALAAEPGRCAAGTVVEAGADKVVICAGNQQLETGKILTVRRLVPAQGAGRQPMFINAERATIRVTGAGNGQLVEAVIVKGDVRRHDRVDLDLVL
ncbi:hypothetical protein GVO57_11755 [Sphingomonas changnyeongensis]|uniref:Uncharacterized protein n=1 Tax=Sphingomonas changnyeongensis TaxID=2698679 RepID=A0A7Z2SA12_9SPHN|nr:hypothetical protein [Sphingomonas changnyeongensis]QHL91364.1 hypothetical protein GVO57_11755 [Sphingomonas changnyeongensis]